MDLPHSWSRDDADEEDATPAERVARWENENVLEEERVQLCQLPTKTEREKSQVSLLGSVGMKSIQDIFPTAWFV